MKTFKKVLVASVVELIIRSGVGNHGLKCSVFRALRLLRVFEKTRSVYTKGIEFMQKYCKVVILFTLNYKQSKVKNSKSTVLYT